MTNFEFRVGDRVYWLDRGPHVYVILEYTSKSTLQFIVRRIGGVADCHAQRSSLWPTATTRLARRRRRS